MCFHNRQHVSLLHLSTLACLGLGKGRNLQQAEPNPCSPSNAQVVGQILIWELTRKSLDKLGRLLWKKSWTLHSAKPLRGIWMKKGFLRDRNGVHSSSSWDWVLLIHMTVRDTTSSSRTIWNMCLELPHQSVEIEWKYLTSEVSSIHLKLLKLTHFNFSINLTLGQETAKVNRCIRTCAQRFTAALSTTTQSRKTQMLSVKT